VLTTRVQDLEAPTLQYCATERLKEASVKMTWSNGDFAVVAMFRTLHGTHGVYCVKDLEDYQAALQSLEEDKDFMKIDERLKMFQVRHLSFNAGQCVFFFQC
jgi:hypothetical protein